MIGTVSSQPDRTLRGRVVDALLDKPLVGVKIHISGWSNGEWGLSSYDSYTTTNEGGSYSINLYGGHYWVSAVVDNLETPGLDYVPGFLQLDITELGSGMREIAADFRLLPGASISIIGLPEFVETDGVPEQFYYSFSILDQPYRNIFSESISTYEPNTCVFLGLEPNTIVVPSDIPIALYGVGGDGLYYVDDNDSYYFIFPQGSETIIDISKAVMNRNIASVRDGLTSTWLQVERLSLNSIDVESEKKDLNTASDFLNLARLLLGEGSYSQCFVNLRAAYILNNNVQTRVANISSDATFSPIPLSFLLVLSSFGLASIFIEKNATRIGTGFITSLFFLGFYYYVSPGWRLADPLLLMSSCIFAASIAIAFAFLLPHIRKDVVTPSGIALLSSLTSTFSLATRNMKRRRLRSLLMLVSIVTFVFAFMAFTSFEFQMVVASSRPPQPYPREPPNGIMIVSPSEGSYLPMSIVDTLRDDPLVSSVAPKTESSPTYMDAQIIGENGYNITIRGVMGISSEEAKMNHLDEAIIGGHAMLEGEHSIMISARAADQLHASPGDKVRFVWNTAPGTTSGIFLTENFMIAGIFDDQMFEQIVDLDGLPIRSFTIVGRNKSYLTADRIAIFSWKELIDLNLGRLTRINVQTWDRSDIKPLALQLAIKWRWFVYTSVDSDIRLYYYRRDPGLSGGTAILMLFVLVGLNILACTLNGVYERRGEITSLALIGLNPTQISFMFLAETGLMAFIGSMVGYLLGLGCPRALLSIGGPGFLTEKISWAWGVEVILMAVLVSVSASMIPALKASTIATPELPLKWKLDHLPSNKDIWILQIPQLVSQMELERFFGFIDGRFKEMKDSISERMDKIDLVDEYNNERHVRKLIFRHVFSEPGSRAFRTENELVTTRPIGSSTYSVDLSIKIDMLYNYEPLKAVRKTAIAVRKLMLQWTTSSSLERWGRSDELIRVENLSVSSEGKLIIKGVHVQINRGEIFGLSGEGRRTLLLAIAGLCKPASGSAKLAGIDTYSGRDDVKGTMDILLQNIKLYEDHSLRWNLILLARLDGIVDIEKTVDSVLERCNLMQYADDKITNLSEATKRKAMIAKTLIKKPLLLILEDPFVGLVESEVENVVALLKDINYNEGITIICSGRSVYELNFSNRIGVLKEGLMDVLDGRQAI